MSLYADLFTLLNGTTDALGAVYPNAAPDKPATRPYLVYTRVSANSNNVLSGNSGLINTRLQIDVYADTYIEAQTVAGQVDTLMRGWALQNVSLPSQDQYEPDVRLHRVILEYSVWHT